MLTIKYCIIIVFTTKATCSYILFLLISNFIDFHGILNNIFLFNSVSPCSYGCADMRRLVILKIAKLGRSRRQIRQPGTTTSQPGIRLIPFSTRTAATALDVFTQTIRRHLHSGLRCRKPPKKILLPTMHQEQR